MRWKVGRRMEERKEGGWMEGRKVDGWMDGRWMDGRKFYTCWTDKSQQYLPENIYSPSTITVSVVF